MFVQHSINIEFNQILVLDIGFSLLNRNYAWLMENYSGRYAEVTAKYTTIRLRVNLGDYICDLQTGACKQNGNAYFSIKKHI